MKKESLREEKGFTLIELLAVIVILAVLMVVAGTNVFGTMNQARQNSFKTEFLTLLSSAEQAASIAVVSGSLNSSHPCVTYSYDPASKAPYGAKDLSMNDYFDNKGNYAYAVKVNYTSGKLVITAMMSNAEFDITGDNSMSSSDLKVESNTNGSFTVTQYNGLC